MDKNPSGRCAIKFWRVALKTVNVKKYIKTHDRVNVFAMLCILDGSMSERALEAIWSLGKDDTQEMRMINGATYCALQMDRNPYEHFIKYNIESMVLEEMFHNACRNELWRKIVVFVAGIYRRMI